MRQNSHNIFPITKDEVLKSRKVFFFLKKKKLQEKPLNKYEKTKETRSCLSQCLKPGHPDSVWTNKYSGKNDLNAYLQRVSNDRCNHTCHISGNNQRCG
jgi:hypothetical protein